LRLTLHHDGNSAEYFEQFKRERVIERLNALDAVDPLTALGMAGSQNCFGVFNLSWQAREHPEWPGQITAEVNEIRAAIAATHGTRLRYVIWAGMGGSIEDKLMYQAVGLLRRGPRFYALDSTDPAKLKYILADITRRSGQPIAKALRSTLVVGMALGMTSFEPVRNLEKLAALYAKYRIDSRPNFIYLTLPGSLLDRFAGPRGYRQVELQLDGANSTAGRHSGPLTRGSLYPLALAGVDLHKWMQGTFLTLQEIDTALRLAAFLHAQGVAGRDKVTLLLQRAWAGAGLWTKQDFEESLGKSEELGVKIVIGERLRRGDYRQDRVFLAVQTGLKLKAHPVALLKFPAGALLPRYMQFMHYVVFGMAYLRGMNFVTQPSVELYKSIANELDSAAAWKSFQRGRVKCGNLSLPAEAATPEQFAALMRTLTDSRAIEYAELTFFGDTRYHPQGRQMRRTLDRAGECLFRSHLNIPVDIYEGPPMNHSYHEMIIGHGKCFSIVLLSGMQERIAAIDYSPEYHIAQFLATQMALQRKGRRVMAITVKDLSQRSLAALDEFFRQTAACLR
jgi:glucose-6-phosphate isomerase